MPQTEKNPTAESQVDTTQRNDSLSVPLAEAEKFPTSDNDVAQVAIPDDVTEKKRDKGKGKMVQVAIPDELPVRNYLPVVEVKWDKEAGKMVQKVHLNSNTLYTFFDRLSTATSSSEHFGNAIVNIGTEPISALFFALDEFNIAISLWGERDNQLRFTERPLSHCLRISSSDLNSVFLLRPHKREDDEREIRYRLSSTEDLANILHAIIDEWRDLLSCRGSLRPRPLSDGYLLDALELEYCDLVRPHFTECERAMQRGHYMEACYYLLVPFGFQPVLHYTEEARGVGFMDPLFKGMDITAFANFVPDPKWGSLNSIYKAAIIVTGIKTAIVERAEADRIRSVARAAAHADLKDEFIRGCFAAVKKGIVFSLALPIDLKILCERLVQHREEMTEARREEKRTVFDKWKKWLGKQPPHSFDWTQGPTHKRKSRWELGRRSLLRFEVKPEDVVLSKEDEDAWLDDVGVESEREDGEVNEPDPFRDEFESEVLDDDLMNSAVDALDAMEGVEDGMNEVSIEAPNEDEGMGESVPGSPNQDESEVDDSGIDITDIEPKKLLAAMTDSAFREPGTMFDREVKEQVREPEAQPESGVTEDLIQEELLQED